MYSNHLHESSIFFPSCEWDHSYAETWSQQETIYELPQETSPEWTTRATEGVKEEEAWTHTPSHITASAPNHDMLENRERVRPLNCFFLFKKDMEMRLKEERTKLKSREFVSFCAARWNEMSAEEQMPYRNKYAATQLHYRHKRSNKFFGSFVKIEMTEREQKLKRPMNAFILWASAERRRLREELAHLPQSVVSKRLGERWRMMRDFEKEPWREEARRRSEAFRAQYPHFKYRAGRKPLDSGLQRLKQFEETTTDGTLHPIDEAPTPPAVGFSAVLYPPQTAPALPSFAVSTQQSTFQTNTLFFPPYPFSQFCWRPWQ